MNNEKHIKLELLDTNKFVKVNDLKEITNNIFFVKNGIPTSDGLLSNEIFGITKDDRANKFAYIDLGEYFMHPLVYTTWASMDNNIRKIVHGTDKFSVNDKGFIIQDDNGSNGIKFLKKNIDKINIGSTDSRKRDSKIKFIYENKNNIFIKELPIIPAFYRDVNTESGRIGVGEINKLYNSLLMSVKSLKETVDLGLDVSNVIRGRIQETLLEIYNWFADEPNLSKKKGIQRRAVLTKTTDYGARLVLSAPELKVNKLEDMFVDLDYSAIPLSSLCANMFPYIIFYIRRFFENEFGALGIYKYIDKKGEIKEIEVKDPLIEFSDTRIKKEIDRFMKGYSNRFIPITVPNKENLDITMRFKGRNVAPDDINYEDTTSLIDRPLTWCDLIYMACYETTKDKHVLITRYPIDNYFNQFPTKIKVASTKKTENIWVDGTHYTHYPYIREKDILKNTSNKFVDTLNICNLYLPIIGGDYDGDQATTKIVFSTEANEELDNFINSKAHYISMGANNVRTSGNEAIQSLFNLTLILPESNLTKPEF